MNTDDLIHILAQAPRPRQKLNIMVFGSALIVLSIIITKFMLGLRPEVIALDFSPSLIIKLAVLAMLALTAVQYLKEQSAPIARRYSHIMATATVLLLSVLVAHEWLTTDHQQITALFHLSNFPACVFFVAFYGLLGAAVLTIHMRASAPSNIHKAASAIGFAAAATGAVGYALHCPIDSPTFIAVAYGIPIIAISLLARLVLPRFLRW